MFKPLD